MNIKPTTQTDIPALQKVLDATALFPGEMLPDMLAGFLNDPECPEVWLTCHHPGSPLGFCFAVPEQLAEGTWNMLAIAVDPETQGQGHGGALVTALEEALRAKAGRILIADTSGTDDFADTRAFYRAKGYTEEASIRAFWGPGDDKIVFWKAL